MSKRGKKSYGLTYLSFMWLYHKDNSVRCWTNENILEGRLTPSFKNDGGNVKVCGCYGDDELEDLFSIKGILKKEGHHSILQHSTVPCGANFHLQQDND